MNSQKLNLKSVSFIIVLKMKYLWLNLEKMYKTHILKAAKLRKIKIDLNKWSDIQSLWSGKVTITNMSILHIQIQAIPFRRQHLFLSVESDKLVLKFIRKCKIRTNLTVYLTWMLTIKLQFSRQCSNGIEKDKQISEPEYWVQK